MPVGEMVSLLCATQELFLPSLAEHTGDMALALAFAVAAAAVDSGCNDSQEWVVHNIDIGAE
jgi:hypothetical protein